MIYSKLFEEDFRQALLDDDPGEYELPVAPDGVAELSEKDLERIVRIAVASLENVQEVAIDQLAQDALTPVRK